MATRRDGRGFARGWLRDFLLGALAVAMASCFSPHTPPCAFTCVTAPDCPDGYACGTDGLCHRNDATDVCNLKSPYDGGVAGTSGAGGVAGGAGGGGAGGGGAGGGAAAGMGGTSAGGAGGGS